MGYDDVIPFLGEFGKYQRRIYFLLCLPAIPCAFHKLAGVFLLAAPNHRCLLPFEPSNTSSTGGYGSVDKVMNLSYPVDPLKGTYATCEYLNANFTDDYLAGLEPVVNVTRSCDRGWVYDKSVYQSSTATEWDMVCEDSWLRATADALFVSSMRLHRWPICHS